MQNMDKNLYPQYNFRFGGVKDTFDKFKLEKDKDGNLLAVDKNTNISYNEPLLIDRVKFSIAWVKSTQASHPRTTPSPELTNEDYEYAFNEGAQRTYASMMTCIHNQLLTTGNIDPFEIIDYVENTNYKYSKEYIQNLFSKKIYVEAVDKWARYAIPNALESTQELMTIEELKNNNIHRM